MKDFKANYPHVSVEMRRWDDYARKPKVRYL
jgi:hypothetical protein